jgi:AraC-like DNA-binding protein
VWPAADPGGVEGAQADGGQLPPVSSVFETADPEQAEDVLRTGYGDLRMDTRGQRGGIRMEQVPLSPLTRFDRNTIGMALDVTGDPLGRLVVGHLRSGLARYGTNGSERSYRPGDVFLAIRPGQPHAGHSIDIDTELVVIDPVLLNQVAATAPTRTPQPLRFTGCDPISAAGARLWLDTSAYVRDTFLTAPHAIAERLVVASAEQMVAAVALAVFPNNALTDPTVGDQRDASPATLRRAVAFIDEHAVADICVADIATAAAVSIRAVQLAFRRHLGTTPRMYLRRVRLDHAHRELTTADPAMETVTAVAYRWGFSSPSRFAAYYRQAYGAHPSQTLNSGT